VTAFRRIEREGELVALPHELEQLGLARRLRRDSYHGESR
jgi:hypothetical protein